MERVERNLLLECRGRGTARCAVYHFAGNFCAGGHLSGPDEKGASVGWRGVHRRAALDRDFDRRESGRAGAQGDFVEALPVQQRRALNVTVSVGVAAPAGEADKLEDILKRADQALYQAKREGRNRVVLEAA